MAEINFCHANCIYNNIILVTTRQHLQAWSSTQDDRTKAFFMLSSYH